MRFFVAVHLSTDGKSPDSDDTCCHKNVNWSIVPAIGDQVQFADDDFMPVVARYHKRIKGRPAIMIDVLADPCAFERVSKKRGWKQGPAF